MSNRPALKASVIVFVVGLLRFSRPFTRCFAIINFTLAKPQRAAMRHKRFSGRLGESLHKIAALRFARLRKMFHASLINNKGCDSVIICRMLLDTI